MNNAEQVADLVAKLKSQGIPLQDVAWQTALACVGWPYVFGASGQECTQSYRKTAYAAHGKDHPTIKTACQYLKSGKSCSGCKWYPNGKRVRCYDCRGFTAWILKQAYDWSLAGAGATSQWNTAANWKSKGEIATMPKDKLCCLFVQKGKTMEHTGLGLNNETIECSSGVQHFTTRNKKWTHWAVPVCVEGGVTPTPTPTPEKGKAIVTGKNLALRQGPSTDCSIVTRIATGTTISIVDQPSGWTYVKYGNKTGFVMDKFIKKG